MQTVREPYEFLVRWVPAGVPENPYAGTVQAQINFAFVTRDDTNTVVSWNPDTKGPFPVALTGNDGIALSEIVPNLNAATLEALAAAQAEISALNNATTTQQTPTVSVSRMQAILALHDAGLLDQVNALIAQSDIRTKLAWETATDFHRTSPTITALWSALGKTEQELDALFTAAKLIEV